MAVTSAEGTVRYQVGRPLSHGKDLMPSDELMEVIGHLSAREAVSEWDTISARLQAALHEFDAEDVEEVSTMIPTVAAIMSGGEAGTYALALLVIGIELGRELERRM